MTADSHDVGRISAAIAWLWRTASWCAHLMRPILLRHAHGIHMPSLNTHFRFHEKVSLKVCQMNE